MEGVETFYGRIQALHGIDLSVQRGEVVALIGANGAGKSTLLMSICGEPRPRHGKVLLDGEDITALPANLVVRRGVAHAPEGRRIFARMSVLENLQLGAISTEPRHFRTDLERVFTLFPLLQARQRQRGGTLSGGEQQMLAIARALMSRPRLLLLDEPSLGLAPLVAKQIFAVIRQLNAEQQVTVLLVEQDAFHALKLAHRAHVLVNGRITLSGSGAELLGNPQVRAAYLDGGHGATETPTGAAW
jgi:branched-chain amino acid transport system ATP-binding protein